MAAVGPATPKVKVASAYPRTITFKGPKKAALKKSRRTKIK